MDLNTNMMVVMDMIAMQNMMAQQQRDMFYAQQNQKISQLYNGQENGQEKYYENNQALTQKPDNKDYRWNNATTDYIPPLRDISPICLFENNDLSYIDSTGIEKAFCRCHEEDDTLIIEASVPEGTLTKKEVQTWLFDTVKKAKDRYISKVKFRIGAEDTIMKQFVKV